MHNDEDDITKELPGNARESRSTKESSVSHSSASEIEKRMDDANKTRKMVPGERRANSPEVMNAVNPGDGQSPSSISKAPRRKYIQTPADRIRELKAQYDAAQTSPYELRGMIARGAESVLYEAICGSNTFCSKSIRNSWSKLLGGNPDGTSEKLEHVKYSTKLRHIRNEFEVSKKLNQMEPMPVVRMFGLRRVSRFGIELGYDLLMERLDGHDLGDKILTRNLGVEDKIRMIYEGAAALDYVHKHNLVHLDIKPSNFMLIQGKVKLIDFGVSVPIGHHASAVTGTGGYLSPEQICKDVIDEKTDIFAFGIAFSCLLGGKPLVQPQKDLMTTKGRQEARYQLESMEQPMLSDVPQLSGLPGVADVLRQCTIPRRDKRISSCMVLMHLLKLKAEQYGIAL